MIIKATRITTASGPDGVGAHVFDGLGNEDVLEVRGCREDLADMVADALRHGARYSIRHVTISPGQATTREQALDLVDRYAHEFGADAGRAVVVEHRKPREGGAGFEVHWHAVRPEGQQGRILDSSWMRARHEKLSRMAELDLGHAMVPGRWNRAVETTLRAEGHHALAQQVAPLALMARPTSSYTGTRHQAARRAGLSMPHTKATAKAAATATWDAADGGKAFAAALAGQGLRLKAGDKPGIILMEGRDSHGDWHDLGAVHRMLKADRQAVADRLTGIDFGRVFDAAEDADAPVPEPAAPVQVAAEPDVAPITAVEPTPLGVPVQLAEAPSPVLARAAIPPPRQPHIGVFHALDRQPDEAPSHPGQGRSAAIRADPQSLVDRGSEGRAAVHVGSTPGEGGRSQRPEHGELRAMAGALASDSLLPLLTLLEPPTPEEVSKIDLVLQLLERMAEHQVQLGQRMAAIESRLAETNAPSPLPSTRTGKSASAR